mgnify:CR=1 FL=1
MVPDLAKPTGTLPSRPVTTVSSNPPFTVTWTVTFGTPDLSESSRTQICIDCVAVAGSTGGVVAAFAAVSNAGLAENATGSRPAICSAAPQRPGPRSTGASATRIMRRPNSDGGSAIVIRRCRLCPGRGAA